MNTGLFADNFMFFRGCSIGEHGAFMKSKEGTMRKHMMLACKAEGMCRDDSEGSEGEVSREYYKVVAHWAKQVERVPIGF